MYRRSNLQCYCRNKQADKKRLKITAWNGLKQTKLIGTITHLLREIYIGPKRQTPASTVIRQLYASFLPTIQLTTKLHISDKKNCITRVGAMLQGQAAFRERS